MQKANIYQRLEVSAAHTQSEKIKVWQKMGFDAPEAEAMATGRTFSETRNELGGIWFAGNVPFPQAISPQHAAKLFIWNFGQPTEGETVSLIVNRDGTNWVIETHEIEKGVE